MSERGGILLKADDGSLYFVRDEILAACKVEAPYLEDTQRIADDDADVEGFAFSARPQQFTLVKNFTSPTLDVKLNNSFWESGLGSADTTIMCPW